MMKIISLKLNVALLLGLNIYCSAILAVPLVLQDTSIPHFAALKGNTESNIIQSNPLLCYEAPRACKFFIHSMDAHRKLGHPILAPGDYTMAEIEDADCYATQFVSAKDLYSAYQIIVNADDSAEYTLAGNLKLRAENLKYCSQVMQKWNDNYQVSDL